jgi:hypothetical protein
MAEYAEPFYDVNLSYAENYERGPFGAFAGALAEQSSQPTGLSTSKSDANFLGFPVNLPFGIPAGPLLNSRFTTAAFRMGFDLAVYKTVRTRAWDCNPFPNVLSVHPRTNALTPGDAELDEGVLADSHFERPLSISNSFGLRMGGQADCPESVLSSLQVKNCRTRTVVVMESLVSARTEYCVAYD